MPFAITFSMSNMRGGEVSFVIVDDYFQCMRFLKHGDCDGVFSAPEGCQGCVIDGNYAYVLAGDGFNNTKNDTIYEIDIADMSIKNVKNNLGLGAHGLCLYNDILYAIMSDDNKILSINKYTFDIVDIYEHKDPRGVNAHINSVFVDDSGMYVTVHNTNGEGYAYRVVNNSKIPVSRSLAQPHDFKIVDDNGFIICNSKFNLFEYNAVPIEKSWKTDCGAYTRGYDIVGEHVYVGCSNRKDREYVVQIEKNTGELIQKFEIAETCFGYKICPEIYSICAIR